MKKNFILQVTLLTVFSIASVIAQIPTKVSKDFVVTTGTPYPVVNGKVKEYFSDGKQTTLSVKVEGGRVTIQRYDFLSMKELSRKVYEDFPEYTKVQKVLEVGDKLLFIYDTFDKKDRMASVYAREINWSDGSFKETKLLLKTASEVGISSYFEGGSTFFDIVAIRFEVYTSYDNTKLLIRYKTKPVVKKDSKSFDVLGFYVFDASLSKQWGGEVAMPYTEKEMNNLAYTVSSNGTAYMLAFILETKTIELITVKSDLSVKASKLAIPANLIFKELKFRETSEGNLSVIGYYANGIEHIVNWDGARVTSINIDGLLQVKISPDGKILDQANMEFPLELINQYEYLRTQAKNEKREAQGKAGISDLAIVNLTLNADGSTTVIGEQQFITKEHDFKSKEPLKMGVNASKNVYNYGDIIATKFDKKGTLIWQKKLPKTQTGLTGRSGMGVRVIKGKTKTYILYLDNIANASISLGEVPAEYKDGKEGYLTAYQIDEATGNIEKYTIVNILDINGVEAFQFKTSRIFDAAEKIFLLEIYMRDKQDTMVKLELKQ